MISRRRVSTGEESDELLCTVRSLVVVREQLPAQGINGDNNGCRKRSKRIKPTTGGSFTFLLVS